MPTQNVPYYFADTTYPGVYIDSPNLTRTSVQVCMHINHYALRPFCIQLFIITGLLSYCVTASSFC